MLIAIWPLIVLILGILLYSLASNVKVAEMGRIAFFVGLLWTVYPLIGKTLSL